MGWMLYFPGWFILACFIPCLSIGWRWNEWRIVLSPWHFISANNEGLHVVYDKKWKVHSTPCKYAIGKKFVCLVDTMAATRLSGRKKWGKHTCFRSEGAKLVVIIYGVNILLHGGVWKLRFLLGDVGRKWIFDCKYQHHPYLIC